MHEVDVWQIAAAGHAAALRQILAEYTNASLDFGVTADGKPYLPGSASHFNLTHSGGWGAVAVCATAAVGIDIQALPRTAGFYNVVRRCFTSAEQGLLIAARADERATLFTRLWAVKEACVKETGEGLAGMSSVQVSFDASGAIAAERADRYWGVCEFVPATGYAGAVALGSAKERPRLVVRRRAFCDASVTEK